MTKFSFDIVGFDLDGTFLDTSGDLAAAVNHALGAAGRAPLAIDQLKPMIGGGAKKMLTHALQATGGCTDEELERLYALLLDHYDAHIAVHSHPFPGAVAAIEALAARGVKIAIVTNKFERFAEKLLRTLGLRHLFDTVIGGDTLGPGLAKPNRAPIDEMIRRCGGGSAAFVGDSSFDIEAARAAGIPNIAVSFGFLTSPVEHLEADAVIDSYDDLIPALERLKRRHKATG